MPAPEITVILVSPAFFRTAAAAILYFHFVVVLFNIFWLVAVPVGAWRGWLFVRNFSWRLIHVIALVLVAGQAVAGRLCFLTIVQDYLQSQTGRAGPASLLTRLVARAVFWPLPDWVFAPLYVSALVWAAILWAMVPPVRPRRFAA